MFASRSLFLFITALVAGSCLANVDIQRDLYRNAKIAADSKDWKTFNNIQQKLTQYPLYPYLEYTRLRKRINEATLSEIDAFVFKYPELHLSTYLRQAYLKHLAKTKRWYSFIAYFKPTKSTSLNCLHAQAIINTQGQPVELTSELWLVGKSQPDTCDPVFKWMKQQGLMSQKLIWGRAELALQKNNLSLAKYLSKSLSGNALNKYKQWMRIRSRPQEITRKLYHKDTLFHRKLGVLAAKSALKESVDKSYRLWRKVKKQYIYPQSEMNAVSRLIAIRSAQRHEKGAFEKLSNLPKQALDDKAYEWRVRATIRGQHWGDMIQSILVMPDHLRSKGEWQYWLARAYEKTGQMELSRLYYKLVSKNRSYYGFLASERLGQSYQFNLASLNFVDDKITEAYELPAVKRIKELYHLDEIHFARVEWNTLHNKLSHEQFQAVAKVMQRWGWHEMAIRAVSNGKHLDDIPLRFPQPYRQHREAAAAKVGIDPNWAYAIMRRESAMAEDAVSSANAKGLMQLLPSTAKAVAKRNRWKWTGSRSLLNPQTNIRFGTAYLSELYEKWQRDDIVLATASYNAGPHRVKKWLPDQDQGQDTSPMPLDVWVDTIPFEETRRYVRIISEYRSVIDWVNKGMPEQYGNKLNYAAKLLSGQMIAKNN